MATNQDVYIKIIAQDGASATFHKIGTTAQMTGNQMSQGAQKASRDWQDAGRKIGLAIGATSALAIRANNQSEQSQARLKASIEATGKSYDQYAQAIDKASKNAIKLAFDDEDAADAIATLTQATGDASRAINDLSLAEDVARARKIDLAAAANIVAAAEEGRYSALARIGIQIDANASKEEALAAIQQKVAGQAQAYAETNAATWDRYQIDAENALEAVGAKLADHQALILSVSAAWTAFGGAIGSVTKALGLGGAAGLGGALALLAGVGYLGYDYTQTRGKAGSNKTDSLFGGYFGGAADLLGLDSIAKQFRGITSSNKVEDQLLSLFYFQNPGQVNEKMLVQLLASLGLNYRSSGNPQQQLVAFSQDASRYGMTAGQYALSQAQQQGYVLDPISGQYMSGPEYSRVSALRAHQGTPTTSLAGAQVRGNIGTGLNAAPATPSATATAAGNYPMAAQMGEGLAQQTQQLKAQYGAYYGLADGIITATDALSAFKTAQDGILVSESKHSATISEYSGQLNALDAAVAAVQEKQASGAALNENETKLLNDAAAARERLTGGVYDETVALGLQAEQYSQNMTAADEFKGATGDMTAAVHELIDALHGIPGYVTAAVDVEVNDGGAYGLGSYLTWLNGQEFRTRWVNETVNITTGQVAGPSIDAMGLGGTVPYAAHGITSHGGYVLVGEYGPEMVPLHPGQQVIPAPATASRRQREGIRGGDIHYHIHGGIHVSANTPDEFATSLGHVRR